MYLLFARLQSGCLSVVVGGFLTFFFKIHLKFFIALQSSILLKNDDKSYKKEVVK